MKTYCTIVMAMLWSVLGYSQDGAGSRLDGNWQLIPSGVEENLLSVHFGSSTHGYIGGEWGRCLKSTTGGVTWTNSRIPSWSWLFAIYATSAEDVHIGAWDTIYNSTDGGQTWNGVFINTVNYSVLDLQFHSPTLGYAFLQASAFKKTTDGGNTWSEMTGAGVIDDFLSGYMLDEDNGWAVGGAGLIAYTNDAGATWWQYDWNGWTEWSALDIEGVHFTSALNGFAVADSGVVFRTTNGGQHWEKYYLAGPEDRLKDIFFLNEELGWIVGYHGLIFSTTDGGETWNQEAVLTSQDLNSVFFIASDLGWAVGNYGTILRFSGSSSSVGEMNWLDSSVLQVSPNPSSGRFTVNLLLNRDIPVNIGLIDMNGREVRHLYDGNPGTAPLKIEVDATGLVRGHYLCRLASPAGQVSRIIIID